MSKNNSNKKFVKRFAMVLTVLFATIVGQSCVSNSSPTPTPTPTPPPPPENTYQYGENWEDEYDKAYTESLLSMGEQEFTMSQIAGMDGVGRKLKTRGEKKSSKYVGIFYFMWLGHGWGDIYDISKLQEQYASLAYDTNKSPLWANQGSQYYDGNISPQNAFHYFEEPLYGYYHSSDKWVIKRHLEQLSLAGVDFLYLDFTNAGMGSNGEANNIYKTQTYALMDVILEMQALGYKVPQIVPLVCNNTTTTKDITRVVEWVYDNYYHYENGKYKTCWFKADTTRNPSGKPMIVSFAFDKQYLVKKEVADAFWFKKVMWPTDPGQDFVNGFPWMDYNLPQKNYSGLMNVSIAQHTGGAWSSEAYLARKKNNKGYLYRGRSASAAQKYAYETDSVEEAVLGKNFNDQWANVNNYKGDDEVWMVTVTGWNEWVAQKLNILGQYATFVDTFDIAFSRDIEMMRDANGYGDNFYMQLADNVRTFKYGSPNKKSATAMWNKKTIDITKLSDWDDISAKYMDFSGDAMNRNIKSVANKFNYTDDSARNDIVSVKIANDEQYLYVKADTLNNITAHEKDDNGWMNLYLSTGEEDGWENYNYLINRSPNNQKTSIEKLGIDDDGKITTTVLNDKADYFVSGKSIVYKISLEALGVTSANEIELKVCDNIFANKRTAENDGVNCYEFGDVMAFYGGGDCAPMGRLNYAYRMAY